MNQTQLFLMLLVSVLLCISAVREINASNYGMGVLLFAIPVCGWISIWVKA